jgi:uncharacterized protein with PQ loop repeat
MENAKDSRRAKVRKVLIPVGVICLVAFALWLFYTTRTQPVNIGSCVPPDGYSTITNVMAADQAGKPIFIARAIIATGEGAPGGTQVVIPACGSTDPALQNVAGIFVLLPDGRLAFVANGAVGMEISPLAQAAQP